MTTPQRDARIDALGNDDRSVLILKDILRELNREITTINTKIFPLVTAKPPALGGTGVGLAPAPLNFTAVVKKLGIFLSWEASNNNAASYEIRRHTILDWDSASFVTRTPSLTVNLDPIPAGTYIYLIKTLDFKGNYSSDFASASIVVNIPSAPSVTAAVIDNNVLLTWTVPPSSFQVDFFNLYRNTEFIGLIRGTFSTTFETVAGTYTYYLEAVDIAGNVGVRGSVVAIVNTPPDFALTDKRTSNLDGTKFQVVKQLTIPPSLLACVTTGQTWEQHYTSHSWTTPQQQIDAGYPIYIQPSEVTGWYEEVIDYGVIISNTIVTINYQLVQIVPSVTFVAKMAVSTDNITYTPFTAGVSQFFANFRYLKLRIEFTGSSDKALAEFSMFQITLDVKREVDSGDVTAVATDVGGTPVTFHKAFKDVDSITATADSIEPITIIYDFLDVPNPPGFKVFALDATGNRVTYLVSWKARGIV